MNHLFRTPAEERAAGYKYTQVHKQKLFLTIKYWIRCTSRFTAGSRIIENNLRGCCFLFLFLATVESSNPTGPYSYLFPNSAEQS